MSVHFNPDHRGVERMLNATFMREAMLRIAEEIKFRAIAIAPVDVRDKHPGRYKASFHTRVHSHGGARHDRAEAIVWNDSPEALYVEWGHHGREPYHFLAIASFLQHRIRHA